MLTCQLADPATKGVEASVKLSKADLVPKYTNLGGDCRAFAEIETGTPGVHGRDQPPPASGDPAQTRGDSHRGSPQVELELDTAARSRWDGDSAIVSGGFYERDPDVKKLLSMTIKAARARGKYVGVCGHRPGDHADPAELLVEEGIDSVSWNP